MSKQSWCDLLEKMDRLPPCVMRFLAREKGTNRLLTTREIALATGLSRPKIIRITKSNTWANIKVADAVAFAKVCGCNFENDRRQRERINRALRSNRLDLIVGKDTNYGLRLLMLIKDSPARG